MTTNMSAHAEGVDTAKSDEKIRASVAFDSRILIIEIKKKKVRKYPWRSFLEKFLP